MAGPAGARVAERGDRALGQVDGAGHVIGVERGDRPCGEAGVDALRIVPPLALKPATIDTYDDHRMAMCFSLAALGGVPVRINDPQCVRKTFPQYFDAFRALAR